MNFYILALNKVALITVFSRGIEKSIATLFSKEGTTVLISAILENEGRAMAKKGGAIFNMSSRSEIVGIPGACP